jgi:hypothetical protein
MELFRYYGKLDEKFKGNDAEGVLVGSFEDNRAGCSGLLDLEPTGGTDAPSVAGLESGESVLRHRGGEIVAEGFGGGEEWSVDDAADGVDAEVVGAGVATAVAVEAGHGLASTGGQGLAKDVAGGVFYGTFRIVDPFGLRHGCSYFAVTRAAVDIPDVRRALSFCG